VAVDEQDRTIELQHFDGTIEELDAETWRSMDLEAAEAPEDWSGSVDINTEDLPDPEHRVNQGWNETLEFLDHYE
jgi:hypothetical protein